MVKWRAGILGMVAIGIATLGIAAFEVRGVNASAPMRVVKIAPKPKPPKSKPPAPKAKPVPKPAAQPYVVKRVLAIEGPMRHGDHVWDDAGVPAGPIVVTIDLAAQTLSVFRDGYEIGAAVILYGADEKPTPLGIFAVTQKDAKHVSNIYGAPMPYMLRLTNDGISIHGSDVEDGYMTHGCIGVPTAFAKKLFAQVKIGDRVIVTRGEMLDVGQSITAA